MAGEYSSGRGKYDLITIIQKKESAKRIGNIKRIGIAGGERLPLGDLSECLGFHQVDNKNPLNG